MLRRSSTAVLVAALGASLMTIAPSGPALGAKAPLKCKTVTEDGKKFRICNGATSTGQPRLKTKDGTSRLDADVTLPAKSTKPLGLIVMLHGLGGDKTSYESNTIEGSGSNYHLNNLWFASRGYAVLTYTARGFHENKCLDESVESTDGDTGLYGPSAACRPQLDSIDHEIKDTQYLVGRLVDGTLLSDASVDIDPAKIGVVGASYGGGHTWLLSRKNVFRSPKGTKIKLAAAVPIIGWTDLVNALLPNGKARDDFLPTTSVAERVAETPGVLKEAFITGFYLAMNVTSADEILPGYIKTWYERFKEGEPYVDEVTQDAATKLLSKRSAYYVKTKRFKTPVLALQGFTDNIFPGIEAIRMVNKLQDTSARYPVRLYAGDIGHQVASNKAAEVAYGNDLVNTWFDHYLKGKGKNPSKIVEARLQDCYNTGPADSGDLYRAGSWAELIGTSEIVVDGALGGTLDAAVSESGSHKTELHPLLSEPCPSTDTAVADGNLAVDSSPLESDLTMLGSPEVSFDALPSQQDMYVGLHLWDVDPATSTQKLVTRGVYRLGSTELQTIISQLNANGWTFPAGHVVRIELTANDAPAMLPPSAASGTILISDVDLSIPQPAVQPEAAQRVSRRVLRTIGEVRAPFLP